MNERKREWKALKRKRILSNESTFRFIVTKLVFVCFFVVKSWKKKNNDVIEFDSESDDDANESKKKNKKRHRKKKQRRKKRQQRKRLFEKKFERFLTHEKKKKQKSKHFLTSMMKERKQVLTTRKNRVKILIADKNKRRKLRERKKRWICATDFLHVDMSFNFIDFIIQKIINIVRNFDLAFQNRYSRKQRVYSRLQSCFHDFRFVDHVDQLFFQLQHVEHRKIRLRNWRI